MEIIKTKKLMPEAVIPTRAHETDAGYDLYSVEDRVIPWFGVALIRTGCAFEIPTGRFGCIYPRSSMFKKNWDSSGVIDSGYRGEVMVMLQNHSLFRKKIKKGDRIAQMIIQDCPKYEFVEVDELSDSDRNTGGFGSTNR